MARKQASLAVTVDELIQEEAKAAWTPPPYIVPHLDKLIQHNQAHPEARLGAIKITAWLERNGVSANKDAVYRWLKKRSRTLQHETQDTSNTRRKSKVGQARAKS